MDKQKLKCECGNCSICYNREHFQANYLKQRKQGYEFIEIANDMGIAESTARSHFSNALKKLRFNPVVINLYNIWKNTRTDREFFEWIYKP